MKVVTFGEIMLRLAPNGYYRFFQDDQLFKQPLAEEKQMLPFPSLISVLIVPM